MTNSYKTEEATLTKEEEMVSELRMLSEASLEAPGVHNGSSSGITGICNVTGAIPPLDRHEMLEEDEELIVTMGNAARARRVNVGSHTQDEKVCEDRGEKQPTSVNGEESRTLATEKNECTWNTELSTTTDGGGDDDEDDYVENCEEENRAYKTSGAATLSQSDHIIQQQQQHEGINALVSKVGLFLDQTWNWLHYFLVTIIFLNLIQLADKLEALVGDARNCVCDGELEAEKEQREKNLDQENSECSLGESELDHCDKTESENLSCTSALEKTSESAEVKMSPNTCSIQNQEEVEKAEEAIMAVGVAAPVVKPEAAVETTTVVVTVAEGNYMKEECTQQQITIILPSDDKVVVVSGEYESSEDNGSDNDSGIRRDSVDSYTSLDGSGHFGDVETETCDKSSDDGTSSCISGDLNDDNTGKDAETALKIISQVESMFSDEHLAKDGFLLKHVRRRSDGFVSLKLVAGLRKVKQISREFPVVLDALKGSSKLEVNSEGTKVRRVEPLTPELKTIPIKSKDKEKETKDKQSSNDESQIHIAAVAIHQNVKSQSKSGNKENNENGQNNKQGGGNNSRRNSHIQSRKNSNVSTGNTSRRNSNVPQHGANNGNFHRKISNTSTGSSNNSSRNNSFSKGPGAPLPADLCRNVYMAAYSSSGEDSPQVGRRRGGSLPISALHRASVTSGSPNSSPPNGTLVLGPNGARPKSNSYCEGSSPTTMSPWLLRRKASACSRLSTGELVINGVLRQPRGPDGTKGFATGYRAMILKERLEQQQNPAISA